jgi:hypothetical protein
MDTQSFRIVFANYFSIDEFKTLLSYLGKVREVETSEATCGNSTGYTYVIRMDSWTKNGEYFRNAMFEAGSLRYCYDDEGRLPLYFICKPVT